MIFTPVQIEEILKIIEYNNSFLIATTLGVDALTNEDRVLLESFGVDPDSLYNKFPPAVRSFFWGRLSAQLTDLQAGKITYSDFTKYLQQGQYIPLSRNEKNELRIAKQKTYGHIKNIGLKTKETARGIIVEEDEKRRLEYEKVIRGEIKRGVVDRKSIQGIISGIATKLEDWKKDWGRLVETEMQDIYNRGRLRTFLEDFGEDALVYKETYEGACRHCIKLHLTAGIGSQPILYKISELIANGTNIGRKVKEWKATVGPVHPWCRCDLKHVPKGTKWNPETGRFEYPKDVKPKRKAKVKIFVGDKEFAA